MDSPYPYICHGEIAGFPTHVPTFSIRRRRLPWSSTATPNKLASGWGFWTRKPCQTASARAGMVVLMGFWKNGKAWKIMKPNDHKIVINHDHSWSISIKSHVLSLNLTRRNGLGLWWLHAVTCRYQWQVAKWCEMCTDNYIHTCRCMYVYIEYIIYGVYIACVCACVSECLGVYMYACYTSTWLAARDRSFQVD